MNVCIVNNQAITAYLVVSCTCTNIILIEDKIFYILDFLHSHSHWIIFYVFKTTLVLEDYLKFEHYLRLNRPSMVTKTF